MQIDVLNIKGEKTGRTLELPDGIYLAVKQYLAAQRQGTHSTKTRAEVHGSSKKLHKQKGTGGSRKGNIRNPLYKGGGTINGPKPHDYDFKLNRKVKDLAKMSALSYKAQEGKIVVVEDFSFDAPKTKDFLAIVNAVKGDNRKSLTILSEHDRSIYLSGRNLPSNKTVVLSDINTYDLVNANVLIFTESAAKLFTEEPEVAEA
jgi:large subunit ribosomal protein L4